MGCAYAPNENAQQTCPTKEGFILPPRIVVDPSLYKKLKKYAAYRGQSVSAVVNEALESWWENIGEVEVEYQYNPPPSRGILAFPHSE